MRRMPTWGSERPSGARRSPNFRAESAPSWERRKGTAAAPVGSFVTNEILACANRSWHERYRAATFHEEIDLMTLHFAARLLHLAGAFGIFVALGAEMSGLLHLFRATGAADVRRSLAVL